MRLLAAVDAANVCEQGLDPTQVTTAPAYHCEWRLRGLARHPSGNGFAALVATESNSGGVSTNEIVLYIDTSAAITPLLVSNGVIPVASRVLDRKTTIPDASAQFWQMAFRPDGALVVIAFAENGAPVHRLVWVDPVAKQMLGARSIVAPTGSANPSLVPLVSGALLLGRARMRSVPLESASTADDAFGAYTGSTAFPALDASTQEAIEACDGNCVGVTTLPSYGSGSCTGCCACLRDKGATQDPFAFCQAQTSPALGMSRGAMAMAVPSADGTKAVVVRKVFEASKPGCMVFGTDPVRRTFEVLDASTHAMTPLPAPSGMVVSNLDFDHGRRVGALGFAANGRQVLIGGPMSDDPEHINVWRINGVSGAAEKMLPADVKEGCSATHPGLAIYLIALLGFARVRARLRR